jgi:plasmid stability protein
MMAKKSHFIRIRVDDELKRALKELSSREDRSEADQTRHLLRKALGLIRGDEGRGQSRSKEN